MYDNLRRKMDFDDLLFKSRNKDYGAYQLRKKYNSVLIGGIILASCIIISAVLVPFLLTHRSDRIIRSGGKFVQVKMETFEPPVEKIIVPPAPPPPAAKAEEIVKYVPPEVVDSIKIVEPKLATTDQILSQSIVDNIEFTGTGSGDDLLTGQDEGGADDAFFLVEIMPSFKGGDLNRFRDWVQRRTNYPQIAIDNKIQGKVFLTFVIETDGSVSNVTIVKGVDPLIDNEAVKAIKASPKWSPGLQRGQPVRVRYSLSLVFAY